MANPYTDPNATLTGAASDQELGRRVRAQQAARAIADQEIGLARQSAHNQGMQEAIQKLAEAQAQQEAYAWMQENMPIREELPRGLDPRGLSYEAAKRMGLVQ